MARKIYKGTGLKFRLNIEADGLSMDDFDFSIKIYTHPEKYIVIGKEDMHVDEDENLFFTLDSNSLDPGQIIMETTAMIPDSDFEGGYRKEIDRKILCNMLP